MPLDSLERIEKAVAHALQDSAYLKLLESNGVDSGSMKREEINPFLKAEAKKWGELVLQLNAPPKAAANQCQLELTKLKSAEQYAIAARDGLITTRRQAQDFKNVLLRFWSEQAQTMQTRLADRNNEFQLITKALESFANTANEHAQIVETIKSEGHPSPRHKSHSYLLIVKLSCKCWEKDKNRPDLRHNRKMACR